MSKQTTKIANAKLHGIEVTRDALGPVTTDCYRGLRIPSGSKLGPEKWVSFGVLLLPLELAAFLLKEGFTFKKTDGSRMDVVTRVKLLQDLAQYEPEETVIWPVDTRPPPLSPSIPSDRPSASTEHPKVKSTKASITRRKGS